MKKTLLISLLFLGSILARGETHFEAFLDGPSEAPPNASPGTGYFFLLYDSGARTLQIDGWFADLIGTTTAAHIHGPTALPGVGTASVMTTTPSFATFPLGVTSGTHSQLLDLSLASSYRPGFLATFAGDTAQAEAALIDAMESGKAYYNIHSTAFPGGEIRGFMAVVPEPGTWMAMISFGGLAMTVVIRRWRRQVG